MSTANANANINAHIRQNVKNIVNKNFDEHVNDDANKNYLCFGKPHRLKSDERKEERKKNGKV